MGKCIIKYKGKKYSEEQFKEYFINNKQEFATSIAKNKDVMDSFKRKMEGIDFVFSHSPELASVGSKAQYLQYLSTIFPNSKVKDIVYHGSLNKIESFDKSKLGSFTKAASAKEAVFFTDSIEVAKTYAVPKNLDETKKGRELLNEFDISKITPEEDAQYGLIKIYKDQISNHEDDFDFDSVSFRRGLNKIKGWKTGTEYEYYSDIYPAILNVKNPKIKDFESKGYRDESYFELQVKAKEANNDGTILKNTFDGRERWGVFESNIYTVFETEQIHILGSKQDAQRFKEFVEKTEQENNQILNSKEFQNFAKLELEKNPETSIEEILEYYKKCKK